MASTYVNDLRLNDWLQAMQWGHGDHNKHKPRVNW